MNLRVPIFDLAQNAVAAAADAEALHAEADAQTARDKVAADAVRAQHTLRQLEASARVSRLEYRSRPGQHRRRASCRSSRATPTPAMRRWPAPMSPTGRSLLLQSQFEYLRAQLQLLRQTGELHGWALGK